MHWTRAGTVAAALAACALPSAARAQASPFVGHWRLNPAMSKQPPGETPPKDVVADIARAEAMHVRWTLTVTDPQGQVDTSTFDLPANGEFYPISADTTAAVQLTAATLQATFLDSTGQSDKLTCTLSPDGRRMTCNGVISQGNGGTAPYVDVFDRS